jgi:hypothetical protein
MSFDIVRHDNKMAIFELKMPLDEVLFGPKVDAPTDHGRPEEQC